MAATIGTIRTAIRDTITATLTTLPVYDSWPDIIPKNQFVGIVPESGEYQFTLQQTASRYFFIVKVGISTGAGIERAQDAIDAFLSGDGANSLRAALRADPDLGNAVVDDIIVKGFSDYGLFNVNNTEFLGASIRLEVWT